MAGLRWGTATSSSTNRGTTSLFLLVAEVLLTDVLLKQRVIRILYANALGDTLEFLSPRVVWSEVNLHVPEQAGI
jgi:hypothetical protein